MRKIVTSNFFILIALFASFLAFHGNALFVQKEFFTHDAIRWYGIYKFFAESISNGEFPFWNFYSGGGTPYYPVINLVGFLDPATFLAILITKVFSLETFTSFIIFNWLRLFIAVAGVYYLILFILKCKKSAAFGTFLFLYAFIPVAFRQSLTCFFLTPITLVFFLRALDNLNNKRAFYYFLLFTLCCGTLANIHIPVYFLFYFVLFFAFIFIFKCYQFSLLLNYLKVNYVKCLFLVFLLLLFLAPVFTLFFVDLHKKESEIFPVVRVLQKIKDYRQFKPSEVEVNIFDKDLYGRFGVNNTLGNHLNFIFPTLPTVYHERVYGKDVPVELKFIPSEMFQYLGIVALLFIFIGLLYGQTPYKKVFGIIAVVMALESTSFSLILNGESIFQKGFSTLFPFLSMIDVLELFSAFLIFSLSILAAIGYRVILDQPEILRDKYKAITTFLLLLLVLKSFFSFQYLSYIVIKPIETVVFLIIVTIILTVFLYLKRYISFKPVITLLLFLFVIDILLYSHLLGRINLHKEPLNTIARIELKEKPGFQWYRELFLYSSTLPYEPILTGKSSSFSLASFGDSQLYMLNRYYGYITHIPLIEQLFYSSIVSPTLCFYPLRSVKEKLSKKEIFDEMLQPKIKHGKFPKLFVEKSPEKKSSLQVLGNIQELPVVEELKIKNLLKKHLQSKKLLKLYEQPKIEGNKLESPFATIEVKEFNNNRLVLSVENNEKGFLYFSNNWSKYWKASVDGVDTKISRANYAFSAIRLPQGKHRVIWDYYPKHYVFGLYCYLFAWILSGCLIANHLLRLPSQRKEGHTC
ncbi:MAG: YfhO family protein [Nitrospinae bacterium]|nr:YfhO family protein [Nitrospinota bacterium]